MADALGVSLDTIEGWCKRGHIPCAKIGGRWVFDYNLVIEWLKEKKLNSAVTKLTRLSEDTNLSKK